MKKKKKILVLVDLKDTTLETLRPAIKFAQMMDANINLFHIKKPGRVIDTENQLSAFRTFTSEHKKMKDKAKAFIKELYNDEKVKIDFSFAIGHPKHELNHYLEQNKADILVLGKKKSKPVKFIGDDFTEVVLKYFTGPILIVNSKKEDFSLTDLSLGILNNQNLLSNFKFSQNLLQHTSQPITTFNFIKNSKKITTTQKYEQKIVEYFFENNNDISQNLSQYLIKSKVNLLYIDRSLQEQKLSDFKSLSIKDIILNTDVSILLSEKNFDSE
ncbi:universal stress protein [Namhaeicola litoreus]|uniref:Universal stress protein n=1 Tax=Namhaeicola litoreus TaxID=1052145 RepID=A0ABW3Y3V8_9FLAO